MRGRERGRGRGIPANRVLPSELRAFRELVLDEACAPRGEVRAQGVAVEARTFICARETLASVFKEKDGGLWTGGNGSRS